MTKHQLIIGNSEEMNEVEDKSIQFVVTSPPYWNLKKYGERGLGPNQAYSKYLYDILKVLKEVKRVLEDGRFIAINIGTAISNDGMKPLNSDIVKIMEELDFTFKKEIIWQKPKGTQGLWQRGVTKFLKDTPYPCFFNLNIMHEYILIFQKKGKLNIDLNGIRLSEDFIKEVSWSIWQLPVSRTKGHPAPFPDALPERLIKLYTYANETVLDPFGGSGTTMKVCRDLGRNSIIYEINPEYLNIIKDKVGLNNRTLDLDIQYDIKIKKYISN